MMENYKFKKQMCMMYYDYFLFPHIEQEETDREKMTSQLLRFLRAMNISFDDFLHCIREYSLGAGLEYIKNLYYRIPDEKREQLISIIDEVYLDDNYMDF